MNFQPLTVSASKAAAAESQPLVLREGQMIHGKVQQLLPGQMAQVQVGGHQLYAKLEVPMQAGDAYYFKVNSTEPELSLQVISGPMKGSEGQAGQLTQLLESLHLPKTAEMREVLASFIKLKIPATRENVADAANLLKAAPEGMKAEALAVIGKMAAARMPMTANVFQSMLQAQSGTVAQQVGTLQEAVQKEPNLPPAVRQQLLNTLQTIMNPLNESAGRELLSQSLTKLLDTSAPQSERFAALQLLKNADILPARASLANLPQQFAELMTRPASAAPAAPFVQSPAAAGAAMQNLLVQLAQTSAGDQQAVKAAVQNLAQQLNNAALPENTKQNLQNLLAQFAQRPPSESSKAAFIQQFGQSLPAAVSTAQAAQPAPAPLPPAVQTLLSQLSAAPAGNEQAVRAAAQNLTQQLNNAVLPESTKQNLQTLLEQFVQRPVSESGKAAFVQQFSQTFTAAASLFASSPAPAAQSAAEPQSAARPPETISPALASVNKQLDVLQSLQQLLGRLSAVPAGGQQAAAITAAWKQQLADPAVSQQIKNELQPPAEKFSQQAVPSEAAKTAFIEQAGKAVLQQAVQQAAAPGLSQSEQTAARQVLLPLLAVPDSGADEALRLLMEAAKDHPQAKQLLQAAESKLAQTLDGSSVKEAVRQIFHSLGLNYEAQLAGKPAEAAAAANTLKPQLLALLQDSAVSPALRDAAETMVLRMNGTMIQNPDSSVQQQIVMQLPLQLHGSAIDATLQWSGRKKENGQIDPAFARVLFYLDLESLSTTLVDMHVQNKVVNLTIFNEDTTIRTAGLALQPFLKQRLETAGYKLSGVAFKPFTETAAEPVKPQQSDERGVDFRI